MATYYFTYGVGETEDTGMPYQGGWTEVRAESGEEAVRKYDEVFPRSKNGFLNCCSVALTEKEMAEGFDMLHNGNGGCYCHFRID